MQVDFETLAQQVADWYNDSSFIEMRTKKQMCNILDKATLKAEEFSHIFKNIYDYFLIDDVLEIMQHARVNISKDISDANIILHRIGKVLNIRVLSDISKKFTSLADKKSRSNVDTSSESIKSLIAAGKDNNLENLNRIYKILSFAAQEGYNSTIEYAVKNDYINVKAEIFDKSMTNTYKLTDSNILIKAAYEGDLTLVESLYKNNVDMKYTTRDGENILHAFSISNNIEGVKFALNFFDINSVNSGNETALFVALLYSRYNVVDYLLKRDDVNTNIISTTGSNSDAVLFRIRENSMVIGQLLEKKSDFSKREKLRSKHLIDAVHAALKDNGTN